MLSNQNKGGKFEFQQLYHDKGYGSDSDRWFISIMVVSIYSLPSIFVFISNNQTQNGNHHYKHQWFSLTGLTCNHKYLVSLTKSGSKPSLDMITDLSLELYFGQLDILSTQWRSNFLVCWIRHNSTKAQWCQWPAGKATNTMYLSKTSKPVTHDQNSVTPLQTYHKHEVLQQELS